MAKIKGIYKGFKFVSQIFERSPINAKMGEKLCWCFEVVTEEEGEMEIGYPTDVKHVAHIGWEGPSGNGPTLMKEFSNAPEIQSSLRRNADHPGPNSTCDGSSSPEGPENAVGGKSTSSKLADDATGDEALSIPKKHKRKKIKSASSKSRRSSRTGKSKAKQPDIQNIAVAARS